MKGKIIVLSAPSGSGKSTIIRNIIDDKSLSLGFSISATSRKPREGELHGKDYYFLSEKEFEERINNDEFIEWEEVYAGVRYGTLESEINRVTESGKNLIMDIDVKGALNIKKKYGKDSLLIFIMPPNLISLENRLRNRGTDSEEVILKRLEKAEYEISFSKHFDTIIVNDHLGQAVSETKEVIQNFIS